MLNEYLNRKMLSIKNIVSIFLVLTLVFNNGNIFSSYKVMYSESEKKILSDGITYQKYNMVTSKGWMRYFIIKADLKNPNVNLRVIYNLNGISKRQNLSDMVNENQKKNQSNTIAATNSDFFNMETVTNTCGAVVIDGRVISTPANKISSQPPFATLYIDKNNKINVKYLENKVKIFSPNGKSQILYGINKKYKGFNDVDMLTKEWGKKSPGAAVEMIVKDGVVQNIKYNGNKGKFAALKEGDPNYGVNIGDNETVFASAYYKNNFLLSNFKIGDEVNVGYDFGSGINAESLKMAVGGKNILLKDGKVTAEAIGDSSTSNALTAFGFDANHNVIMFAVDGKQAVSAGMTMSEVAEILKSNGAVDAISFDGGGSTTAMVKLPGESNIKTVNSPSDGQLRQIAEGLALESTGKGELDNIILSTQSPYVFNNSLRKINVIACDKYNNKLKTDLSDVNWKLEGVKGNIIKTENGAEFLPTSNGKAVITAELGDIKSTININVVSNPISIYLNGNSLDYLDNNYDFTVTGIDKDGIKVPIENKSVSWTITDNNIGTINNGIFKTKSGIKDSTPSFEGNKNNKTALIKASFSGKTANCIVGRQYEKKLIDDFSKSNAIFSKYPNEVKGSLEFQNNVFKTGKSALLKYDFTATNNTRAAYIDFNNKIIGNAVKIGMWVYGNKSEHMIRGIIKDANNKNQTIDFVSKIDWSGWRWIESDLSKFKLNQTSKLSRIYLVETNASKKDVGQIYFDDVYSLNIKSQQSNPEKIWDYQIGDFKSLNTNTDFSFSLISDWSKINVADLPKLKLISKNILPVSLPNKTILDKLNTKLLINQNTMINNYKEAAFIRLNANYYGITSYNPYQWGNFVKALKTNTKENVFVCINKPISKINMQDRSFLLEKLSNYKLQSGKNIYLIQYNSNVTSFEVKDGIRYINVKNNGLKNIPIIYVTKQGVRYNIK